MTDTPKDQDAGENNEISLDDIDRLIEEDDPQFNSQLNTIAEDQALAEAEIDTIALDDEGLLEAEEEPAGPAFSERHPRLVRLAFPVFWFIRMLTGGVRVMRNLAGAVSSSAIGFFLHGLPDFLRYLQIQVKSGIGVIKGIFQRFFRLPLKAKLVLFTASALLFSAIFLVRLNLKGRWLPAIGPVYITSLTDVAERVENFEAKSKWVNFYQAFPQPEHTVLMPKITLNLKRIRPGDNPMVSFQLFVSTDSQDTAIEVRDREKELIDRVAREAEELTYREVVGPTGKERLKKLARNTINEALNQGRVHRTYFRIIVIKP